MTRILLTTLGLFFSGNLLACQCWLKYGDDEERGAVWREAQAVFVGIGSPGISSASSTVPPGMSASSFVVAQSLKGNLDVGESIEILQNSGFCQMTPVPDEKYILGVRRIDHGWLLPTCTYKFMRSYTDLEEIKRYLFGT